MKALTLILTCLVSFLASRPSTASQVDQLLNGIMKKTGGIAPVILIMEKNGNIRPTGSAGHNSFKQPMNNNHKQVLHKVQNFVRQLQRSTRVNSRPHATYRSRLHRPKYGRSHNVGIYMRRLQALRTLALLRASVNCASNNIQCKQSCPSKENECDNECDEQYSCDDKGDECDDEECGSAEGGGSTKGPVIDECANDYCD